MLYPAPAAVAWSPLGRLCITENKYPVSKKSFIGEPQVIRRYLDSHRIEASFNALRKDEGVEVSRDSSSRQSGFEWQVDEEVELAIFNRGTQEQHYHQPAVTQRAEERRQQPKKE